MAEYRLTTPLKEQDILKLRINDKVFLTGTIITARDKAHQYLLKETPDLELNGSVLYHCGPVVKKPVKKDGWYEIVSAGPTTSERMELYESEVIKKYNIRAIIGKGGMGRRTLDALKNRAVYLSATGGAAALLAKSVVKVRDVLKLSEFGIPEALWILEVKDFPAVVTMDAHGNSLHDIVQEKSGEILKKQLCGEYDENRQKSLDYHSGKLYLHNPIMGSPGKISALITKSCDTQEELSLAYTPFVGKIVEEIAGNPEKLAELTGYSNRGAVISDGTAILGFGDLGPKAAIPVMEGKCVLFKAFGDVNMDSIVINEKDPGKIVELIMKLEPNYAGINLEDISAPRCFEIEEELQKRYKGFIFHDDQHGTAVITLAGLLNALELISLKKEKAKIVICGAGAAAIATARLYKKEGIKKIVMIDRNGVIYKGRQFESNRHKEEFAIELGEYGLKADNEGRVSLGKALEGANVFLGLSAANLLKGEMVEKMAKEPIVISMANPVPEIHPEIAKKHGARIVATGRSDFPNQINNVLGFPGIFRGALDALISKTTEDIKLAAAYSLKDLAHKPVPGEVKIKYPASNKKGIFEGEDPVKPEYIVPLALDPRVAVEVAASVFKTAFKKGIARAELPKGFSCIEEYLPHYKRTVMERIRVQERLRNAVRNVL